MLTSLLSLLWILFAYLIGSISSAIIVSKLFSLNDPRTVGSGNPGATNVLRSGNKFAAIFTLLGDMLKGYLPVFLAMSANTTSSTIALVAIAAFMGHLFPVFFAFKGGKGVATALGVFLALSWKLFAVFVLVWLIMAAVFRYSSLAALTASFATGIASFIFFNQAQEFQLIGAIFLIIIFLFQRHQENIARLQSGQESKINIGKNR